MQHSVNFLGVAFLLYFQIIKHKKRLLNIAFNNRF